MKQRGRKSSEAARFSGNVTSIEGRKRVEPAPSWLEPKAKAVWDAIMKAHSLDFFGPADLPLLAEYCHTVAVLIPKVNEIVASDFGPATLDARDKLVRQSLSQATRLRLCVSSRKRADTAEMRDSVSWGKPPWEAV